ncbi:hypothetical protein ABIB06_004891 [Bradyrhizobium sp. LB8.2]|uniref:hypothetical protein n=1 Tax=Bradyrhizobium sp. LB8.2 TaxID=3156330 RepID=UPI003390BD32
MTVSTIIPDAGRAENIRLQAERRSAALVTLRNLRNQARAEIERLIAFLDASEIDPDLEPALGFPEANISVSGGGFYGPSYTSQGNQTRGAGTTDDREADNSDLEPSLCGVTADGFRVNAHCRLTGAMAVDDGEQEAEDEPSLGSVDTDNQERWAAGKANDTEWQCDDEGAHDELELSLGWTVDGCRGGFSNEEVL